MSRDGSYPTGYAKVPRLLSPSCTYTPRYSDMDNHSYQNWPSARTSYSVGEEMHSARTNATSSSLRSHTALPYYTKYLERKMETMQERHQNIYMENMNLNNQLTKAELRVQELERRAATLEDALLQKESERELRSIEMPRNTNVSTEAMPELRDAFTETDDDILEVIPKYQRETVDTRNNVMREQHQQTDCQQQQFLVVGESGGVDGVSLGKDLVPISASELSRLEQDMKSLRDEVRAKEEMWDQALEHERNHREHLVRLSIELVTVRQLSESRHDELQCLAKKLAEGKEELRVTQKDLSAARKTIAKMQQRQRATDEHSNAGVEKQPVEGNRPESSNSNSRSPRQKLSRPMMQMRRDNRSSRVLERGDTGNSGTKEAPKA